MLNQSGVHCILSFIIIQRFEQPHEHKICTSQHFFIRRIAYLLFVQTVPSKQIATIKILLGCQLNR